MKKFAALVITYRLIILIVIGMATLFWALWIPKMDVSTNFDHLLPETHPYVKIHKEFRRLFGGANFLAMVLEVRDGNIFNSDSLSKIKYISEQLFKIPGVDRYKILSIAERSMKDFRYTTWGIESGPLMWPAVPQTEEAMENLKNAIWSNASYYGSFVSFDNKKTLILADFLEKDLDYSVIYRELNRIRSQVEDHNHILSIVGNPMHLGTVRHMVSQVNYILVGTVILIPILLFFAYRSVWATLLVPSAGVISGIWGLGFMGMMGYDLDPLIYVMPFLIALMAFRHSHQLYNRFYEEYIIHGDRVKGARTVIEKMFLPGLTSVITDAFGIAIVAVVPIPLLRSVAIACSFWSIITVFIGLILTPIMMTYVPISKRFLKRIEMEREREKKRLGWANKFADWLGPWLIAKRGRNTVVVIVMIILGFSYYWSEQLIVGDATVGSNYLYDSSRYNQDSIRINKTHPLINPLTIIVYGKEKGSIRSVKVLKDIYEYAGYMQQDSGAAGVQNIVQPLKGISQGMHGNDPKWFGFPDSDRQTIEYFTALTRSGDPGDMDRFIDYHERFTNITVFYKDKTGPTIRCAIDNAKNFIQKYSNRPEAITYKLAGGVIGVEAAINEVVAEKQLQTLLIALFGVFVFCSLNFRSFKAGLVLMLPLAISNFMAFAYMAINEIGLSISTLPVSAAGIGMGVDYGIYLVARIEEEKLRNPNGTLEDALIRTIQTYGKSIIYIAGTLVLGLLVWVLSPLKFQAQMGMMLAVILFLNCLGAIFLVPVLVLIFKPKFLITKNNDPKSDSKNQIDAA